MGKAEKPRPVKVWEVVEIFPDGTEFRRTSGSLALCNYVAAQLIDAGFKANVRPYTGDDDERQDQVRARV